MHVCLSAWVFIWVGVCVAESSGMRCNKQMLSLYEVFTTGSAPSVSAVCKHERACVRVCVCVLACIGLTWKPLIK